MSISTGPSHPADVAFAQARENTARLAVYVEFAERGHIDNLVRSALDLSTAEGQESLVGKQIKKDLAELAQSVWAMHWASRGSADRDDFRCIENLRESVASATKLLAKTVTANAEKLSVDLQRDVPLGRRKASRSIKVQPGRASEADSIVQLDRALSPVLSTERWSILPLRAKETLPMEGYVDSILSGAPVRRFDLGEYLSALRRLASSVRHMRNLFDEGYVNEAAYLSLRKVLLPHVEDYLHDLITIDRDTVDFIVLKSSGKAAYLFGDKSNGCGTVSENLSGNHAGKLVLDDYFRGAKSLVVCGPRRVHQLKSSQYRDPAYLRRIVLA